MTKRKTRKINTQYSCVNIVQALIRMPSSIIFTFHNESNQLNENQVKFIETKTNANFLFGTQTHRFTKINNQIKYCSLQNTLIPIRICDIS